MIDNSDTVFLIETHHAYVPMKASWRVHGEERQPGSSAGAILVLIRDGCSVATFAPDFPFDGFVWLQASSNPTESMHIGWVYIFHDPLLGMRTTSTHSTYSYKI